MKTITYKGISFSHYNYMYGDEDWVDWVPMCSSCAEKHGINHEFLPQIETDEMCGVEGCNNIADYCFDVINHELFGGEEPQEVWGCELCPNCEEEVDYDIKDCRKTGLCFVCPNCGEKILACSACSEVLRGNGERVCSCAKYMIDGIV